MRLIFPAHILAATALWAQSSASSLSVLLEGADARALAGAVVTVRDENRNFSRAQTTGPAGAAVFSGLPPAAYTVTVALDGFLTPAPVPVNMNVTSEASVRMTLVPSSRRDSVTVTGEAVTIVTDAPAVRTVIDRQFVGQQPLNGRTLQSLIGLVPGVVTAAASLPAPGQFSVNGQRASSNNFQVDGVSANFGTSASVTPYEPAGGTVPALNALGTTASLASLEAVEEFAIQTSTYAPEYGRQPGGQVSIVTRSGSNQWHGSLFEYFRNDKLDANNWFANANRLPRGALRQNDFGGSLGGRLVRDRTFFFAAHESLLLRQPFVTSPLTVPSLDARARATGAIRQLLNGFPLPVEAPLATDRTTSPYLATLSNPASLHSTSARLDHRLNDRLQAFGRFGLAPSQNRERAKYCATSCVSVTDVDVATYTGGLSWSPSPRLLNDLRLNYSRSTTRLFYDMDTFGGAVIPDAATLYPGFTNRDAGYAYVEVDPAGANTLSDGLFVNNEQRQWNIVENLSYTTGAHSFKAGADYRRLNPVSDSGSYRRQFRYNNIAQLAADSAQTGALFAPDVVMRPVYTNASFYAQDVWRVNNRLTLTYGLRYELAPSPKEANGNMPATATHLDDPARLALSAKGEAFYAADRRNWAPRLGLAIRLNQSGTWMIRSGAGLFYDLGYGFTGNAFSTSLWPFTRTLTLSAVAYNDPRMSSQPPAVSLSAPYPRVFAYEDRFRTPRIAQYNLTLVHQLTRFDTVSAAYVGASGRRLARIEQLRGYHPSFTRIDAVRANAESAFHSLQLQYDRKLSRGLQSLVSYTWGKSLDTASDESVNNFQAPASRIDPAGDRGLSLFDIRHSASVAVSYETRWGVALDGIFRARSSAPVNILTGRDPFGFGFTTVSRPDLVAGQPLYVEDAGSAGGRRFNPAAFDSATPVAQRRQGTLGRNVLRGLGAAQLDLALRKRFTLGERAALSLRAELFNLTNTPNFANPVGILTSPTFGRSTQMLSSGLGGLSAIYQQGGSRSAQLALRFTF